MEENKLAAEGQHALFPVVWVTAPVLENPIVWSHFASEHLAFHVELPYCGLSTAAELFLEDIVASRVLATLHSL